MADSTSKQDKIVSIDEDRIKRHLGEIVRGSVQETLNELLDAEARGGSVCLDRQKRFISGKLPAHAAASV